MASKNADYDTSKLNVHRSDIPTRKLLLTLLAISMGTVIECECLHLNVNCSMAYTAASLSHAASSNASYALVCKDHSNSKAPLAGLDM
jgi:hypothetical protein